MSEDENTAELQSPGVTHVRRFTRKDEKEKRPQLLTPNTILVKACTEGDQFGVKLLLSGGLADINTKDQNGKPPVMIAAMNGYENIFHLLGKEGADLTLTDEYHSTILHIACETENLNIVKYILNENIVDINSRDDDDMTPLMTAALWGHADVFCVLVGKGADLLLVTDDKRTMLHFACSGGSITIVKHVLSHTRVDINSRDHEGTTPVINAASYGHKDVFDLLVRKGADLTLKNDSDTILCAASRGGNAEIVKYILRQDASSINSRRSDGMTPVLLAAYKGHWEVFSLLVSNEANITLLRPETGENILHVACRGGNMKIVKYVLKQNILDINWKTTEGFTPAMIAASGRHNDVFDLLVEKGADLALVDNDGINILHLACLWGNIEVVKYVLTKDIVDINVRSMDKTTPVMEAVIAGQKEMLYMLSINGADMTTTDESGYNILHLAVSNDRKECARYIITQDFVNINASDDEGMTPLLLAAFEGNGDVFALLVRKGADLTSVDADGDNILLNACVGGNVDIVKYLITLKDIVNDINKRGKNGLTAAMVAARWGQKTVVDLLVKNGADLTLVDDNNDTILHLACDGNVQTFEHLLSYNTVDINTRGANGRTPLLAAAARGNKLVFDELLKKGANASMTDNEDNNILHLGAEWSVDMGNHILSKSISTAARMATQPRQTDQITPILHYLHWQHIVKPSSFSLTA
ncbi:putative ankyrin repeat protein RF_0381 [Haliotis asinina]|uniref:putative ankyrin repeat protein RF_0381 n=1 Tax=Haliotis asinina TaxID=109174 RepID=UPI0035323544